MKERLNVIEKRATQWMLGGALLAFCLLGMRAFHVISFGSPYHVVTSGYEEESLFAIWKYIHGWPVYSPPHEIPFAASYFNWLFYAIYGTVTGFILTLFHLSAEWIPTIGRCLTLSIVGLGTCLTYRLLAQKAQTFSGIALSFSVFLWLGPLIGYWAMTVRPDVLALFWDVFAAYSLVTLLSSRPLWAIVLAVVGCYLSWSLKQINIVMPLAIGLFLITQQRWRLFMLFSMLLTAAYAITLGLASQAMLNMLFFVNTAIPISSEVFLANLLQWIKKSLPIELLLLFFMLYFKSMSSKAREQIKKDPLFRLGWCGLFSWAFTLLPASSKIGSADNYHFIALFFLILIVAPVYMTKHAVWQARGLILAGLTYMTSIVFAMQNGSIALVDEQHEHNSALKKCISQLAQPLFVMNHYAALPWINPSPYAFVLAYNYWADRALGIPFEQDGIGGLIRQGYFQSLILPKAYETLSSYDGGELSQYRLFNEACDGWAVFVKKEQA